MYFELPFFYLMIKYYMINKILTSFFLLFFYSGYAAQVDTVLTRSDVMNKDIKAVVILPDSYKKNAEQKYPVVYLLHGYSGNYAAWLKASSLLTAADYFNMIIVSADGGFSSWYWDSPIDKKYQYETYISKELVNWVDARYHTMKTPKARAITGLSMGGYGSLFLAIKHQDVFGAVGSMSGGVDIRPFPNNWDMAKRIGKYNENKQGWDSVTIKNMLHLIEPNKLKIIFDCGKDDFFFQVNESLHQTMLYMNIAHDYTVRPGAHDWAYWQNAIQYQLLFFNQFFNEKSN